MSCKNCGKSDNPDQSNFCNRCGATLQRIGECAVCLQDNLLLKPLSCGHSFCQANCYSRCCKKCPLCRKTNTFLDDTVNPPIYVNGCSRCNCTELIQKNFHLKCTNCSYEFMDRDVKKINIDARPEVLSRELFPIQNIYQCSYCSFLTCCANSHQSNCSTCHKSLSGAIMLNE